MPHPQEFPSNFIFWTLEQPLSWSQIELKFNGGKPESTGISFWIFYFLSRILGIEYSHFLGNKHLDLVSMYHHQEHSFVHWLNILVFLTWRDLDHILCMYLDQGSGKKMEERGKKIKRKLQVQWSPVILSLLGTNQDLVVWRVNSATGTRVPVHILKAIPARGSLLAEAPFFLLSFLGEKVEIIRIWDNGIPLPYAAISSWACRLLDFTGLTKNEVIKSHVPKPVKIGQQHT